MVHICLRNNLESLLEYLSLQNLTCFSDDYSDSVDDFNHRFQRIYLSISFLVPMRLKSWSRNQIVHCSWLFFMFVIPRSLQVRLCYGLKVLVVNLNTPKKFIFLAFIFENWEESSNLQLLASSFWSHSSVSQPHSSTEYFPFDGNLSHLLTFSAWPLWNPKVNQFAPWNKLDRVVTPP